MKSITKKISEISFFLVKLSIFLMIGLTFSKKMLILFGKYNYENIKELSFFLVSTYLVYIFILKEIDKKTFKNFMNISYFLIPSLVITIFLRKEENQDLWLYTGTVTCLLIFLVALVFLKCEINKRISNKIYKKVVYPIINFDFSIIRIRKYMLKNMEWWKKNIG
jgi:hypothetical protein